MVIFKITAIRRIKALNYFAYGLPNVYFQILEGGPPKYFPPSYRVAMCVCGGR